MMKKYCNYLLLAIGLTAMVSCGGSAKIDSNQPKEIVEVIAKTEHSLSRGDEMVNFNVITSKLPLALLDNEYKSYRDRVNKAQLDYRACLTRGLDQAAQKNIDLLKSLQTSIVENAAKLEEQSPEYIFVLADVKERTRRDGKLSGYIGIFDAVTLEKVDMVQVTTPLYNNAVMVTLALEGKLSDPAESSFQPGELQSSNPVVEFILKSNPK